MLYYRPRPAIPFPLTYADYLASFPSFCTYGKKVEEGGVWEQTCLLLHLGFCSHYASLYGIMVKENKQALDQYVKC